MSIFGKILQETTAAITSIKRYESVDSIAASNQIDQRIDGITDANKYPLLSVISDKFIEDSKSHAVRYRYTSTIILMCKVGDTSDQLTIMDTLATATGLVQAWQQAAKKHPATYNGEDRDAVTFTEAQRLNLGTLDDDCVGYMFNVSMYVKEPAPTCVTPVTTMQYYNGGYVTSGYV